MDGEADGQDKRAEELPTPTRTRTAEAASKRREATRARKSAAYGSDESSDLLHLATSLEEQASELMRPVGSPVIRSGEVFATGEHPEYPAWEIRNTLANPDQAALDASVVRTDLLFETHKDLLPLAIDVAQSAEAGNSLEKMLAHQLAALHLLMMKSTRRALQFEQRVSTHETLPQPSSIELGRLTSSVARMAMAFQEGLGTLQRLKHGTAQTVTVRHVTVQAGAQAVIGAVQGGGSQKGASAPCGNEVQNNRSKPE